MALTSLFEFGVSLAITFLVASSGAAFRPGPWYASLRKPSWTPPNWAFPVVWSALYVAMASASWLVWDVAGWNAMPALALYLVNLLLNASWSYFFFGRRRMDWALADVALLWLSIVFLIPAFAAHSTLAALLLAPYLLWVSIAAALNVRMIQLNRSATATR